MKIICTAYGSYVSDRVTNTLSYVAAGKVSNLIEKKHLNKWYCPKCTMQLGNVLKHIDKFPLVLFKIWAL